MVRPRSIALAAAMVALLLGAMAVPAAAANPRLAVVNGIPGKNVDVCIGNREARSNLKYGRWFQASVLPGNRVLRIRQAAPGRCIGRLLGQENLALLEDDDLTIVATRKPDKVLVFTNNPVPIGPSIWQTIIRHAADVGPVVMAEETTVVINPTALPQTWSKGDEQKSTGTVSDDFYLTATKLDKMEPLAGPKHFLIVEGRRGEIYLVGSKPRNARFVTIYRTLPTP